jgi:hypothetical protein
MRAHHLIAILASTTIVISQSAIALNAIEAAIVPEADIVGTLNVKSANNSAIVKMLSAEGTNENDPANGTMLAKAARFEAATGITADDVVSVAFSCDIDTAKLDATTPNERVSNMNALLAVQLAKPITIDKLKLALKLEYGSEASAGVTEVTIGATRGLKINATTPTDPAIYLTIAPGGNILVASFNAEALESMQQRIATGALAQESDVLTVLDKGTRRSAQIRTVFKVPASVRANIRTRIADMQEQVATNPGMAIGVGIARLFRGIKSISGSMHLGEDAYVSLTGDLGSAEDALQASMLLDTFVVPLLQVKLTQSGLLAGSPSLGNLSSVTANASQLKINFKIPGAQLISNAQSPAAATAGPAIRN